MGVTLTESLTRTRNAPAYARTRVRVWCRDLEPELRWDVELVVSELVTNAVLHGGDPITLTLDVGDVVLVVVSDGGEGVPRAGDGGPDGEGGRGLAMVAGVVSDWGVRVDENPGKEVWALLSVARPASSILGP